ncbi:MarR family transcriptional regulator [Gordonibacter massiliensis (ex Traore et al. 2017)]|uniref:MarR family transcriptional regulator n=1 Tax=Gordonibacter massiliensis (ex Traore et al. 2017) TaxID=1841863 RepID=UPI001C8C649C|nr:winged helix-turn-helix transcriptional regulator [Gordonibacter massiliensis (ex Traore et al. 2017)]MBX9034600.1 winged helix-turn-helix transcriptional regulator [Gordonibacter massiliensis (ex Traore et al. 2017)]
MKRNCSPDLLFEPSNDTDDYTQVTMFVNEEFAALKAAEDKALDVETRQNDRENDRETDRENDAKGSLKGKERALLDLLQENPALTISGMRKELGMSESTINRMIKKLKAAELLKREGPDKGGFWKVNP